MQQLLAKRVKPTEPNPAPSTRLLNLSVRAISILVGIVCVTALVAPASTETSHCNDVTSNVQSAGNSGSSTQEAHNRLEESLVEGVRRTGCADPFGMRSSSAEPRPTQLTADSTEKPQNPQTDDLSFKNASPISGTFGPLLGDEGKPLKVRGPQNQMSEVVMWWKCWKASDGKNVWEQDYDLITLEFAADYLSKKIAGARILQREALTNAQGESIGQRVVALFSIPTEPHKRGPDDPHATIAMVVDLVGTHYSQLYSYYLDDALALEKYLEKVKAKKATAPQPVPKK
jgi:hypothetical protein